MRLFGRSKMNRIGTYLLLPMLLLILAGCSVDLGPFAAQFAATSAPSCAALGGRGVTPEFKQLGANDDISCWSAYVDANPPCIPSAWFSAGCSITVLARHKAPRADRR